MKVAEFNTGTKIINISPHDTRFQLRDGSIVTVPGNPSLAEKVTLFQDHEFLVDEGAQAEVQLMDYKVFLTKECYEVLSEVSSDVHFVLLPVIFNSVDKGEFEGLPRYKFVAYMATDETSWSRPQDKIARGDMMSLIW